MFQLITSFCCVFVYLIIFQTVSSAVKYLGEYVKPPRPYQHLLTTMGGIQRVPYKTNQNSTANAIFTAAS